MNRYRLTHHTHFPILKCNTMNGKCIHSYQVDDGLFPYDIEPPIGSICQFCNETITHPRILLYKRYGKCLHSYQTEEQMGTTLTPRDAICPFCHKLANDSAWQGYPEHIWSRAQEIKHLITIGSKWKYKPTGEVFTVYRQEKHTTQEANYLVPHPEHTFFYEYPTTLAELYEHVP